MQTKKRAHHVHPDVVEDRLAALRRRVPAKPKKTVLQGHVDELISLKCQKFGDSSDADGLSLDEFAAVAQGIVGNMRAECMRVHGRDVFDVPEIKTQIEGTIEGFYNAQLEKNMEVCFEAIEKYVSDEPLLLWRDKTSSPPRSSMISVSQFEKKWNATRLTRIWRGDGEHIAPVVFDLPNFIWDSGFVYNVKVLPRLVSREGIDAKTNVFFAEDASKDEMASVNVSSITPETRSLGLIEYINICLRWPRVHRAESFGDALHAILETHIRKVSAEMELPIDLEEALDRIGWAADSYSYRLDCSF